MKAIRLGSLLFCMSALMTSVNGQNVVTVLKNDGTFDTYEASDVERIYFKEFEYVTGEINGHEYVDMGVPLLWATCNVGATKPEEKGAKFAWAETASKEEYTWDNLKYHGKEDRYWRADDGGDGQIVLLPEDDAASQNWGDSWRMPTVAEMQELIDACEWEYTSNFRGTHAKGVVAISKINGNVLFFPTTCYVDGSSSFCDEVWIWSSSLYDPMLDGITQSSDACCMRWHDTFMSTGSQNQRKCGLSVRAVSAK